MRALYVALGGIVALALLSVVAGCTAVDRLKAANDAAGAFYGTVADARDHQVVTQAEIDRYKPARRALDATLDRAGERLKAGDVAGMDDALAEAKALLEDLRPLLNYIETLRAKGRTNVAAPAPGW